MELQIVDYVPSYQPYFERFNKDWLEEYFSVEPLDKWVLENPEEAIIAPGGKVYFAVSAEYGVVGTVALRVIGDGEFELTKMAVDRRYRGGGIGKILCQAAIDKAMELGVKRLILYSNRRLENAVHIYHRLGFEEIPVLPGTYERSDIMMEYRKIADGITTEALDRIRKETAGTEERIHFNNAGSSLPPDIVVDTVVGYLKEEAKFGGYEVEYAYREQLEHVYDLVARLINSDRDEIALVENASMAWGLAFNGIRFSAGDVVVTSEMEYVTNLMGFLHLEKTHGIVVKVIPQDEQGNFPLDLLEDALKEPVKLIAITHIPSASGAVLPIVEIGKIARRHDVLYLVDACQTVGQMPIDVREIGCDILSVTGRKYLRAPRGTGFLFVRAAVRDQLELLLIDGHTAQLKSEQEYSIRQDGRRFELYEKNRALVLGLGKAVEYALAIGVGRGWKRIQMLSTMLRSRLRGLEGVTVHDLGSELCGIVTFSLRGVDSQAVKERLATRGINVSVGLAKSTLIYMNRHQLTSVVRASVHYYNTEEEIDIFCKELGLLQ